MLFKSHNIWIFVNLHCVLCSFKSFNFNHIYFFLHRAVHASAVYHLLVARLDRYLKNKKNQSNQFAKLEVIKKSNLSTENVHAQNSTNRSKRFTFRGKKIDSKSRSQPSLAETETLGDEDSHILELIAQTQQIQDHLALIEKNENSDYKLNKDRYEKTSNSTDNLSVAHGAEVTRRVRGHKRASSSVDANDVRKSHEIQETIRNSLICDSHEDLSKISSSKGMHTTELTIQTSPKEPFSQEKGIITRKQSFDVTADILGSPNEDKTIDVTKFIEPSSTISTPPRTRRDSRDKKPFQRKASLDTFDTIEVGLYSKKML